MILIQCYFQFSMSLLGNVLKTWLSSTFMITPKSNLRNTYTTNNPQGGILSPIIFIVYGADMSDWVCNSSLYGYADDTSSSICDEDLSEILRKLEIDADRILRFMASNGLVANPSKTTFMVLIVRALTKSLKNSKKK